MKPRSRDPETLYWFHKELNRPFADPDALLARGLELLAERVGADRIAMFEHRPGEAELALRFCRHRGQWLEMDQEIHLTEFSPLWRLVAGGKRCVAYETPRPMLYLPLRWPAGREGQPLGALRLERLAGTRRGAAPWGPGHTPRGGASGGRPRAAARPFTAAERELACALAAELSQNLRSIQLSTARQRQLKRMEALTELAAVFATSLRVEDGLKLILQGVAQHFRLDRVRLYLVDRASEVLRGELSVDIRGQVMSLRSEEISLTSSEHRFARILRGAGLDSHMKRYEDRVVYLPLSVQGQKIGLLILDNLISQQPIAAEDIGLLKSFAGQIALAVDNARLFEEVQELSLYDSLTGLPVRRFFHQRFQEELYRVERSGEPLSLAMMDVDYFKGVNDTFGHQVGDQVLKEAARRILGKLRKIDFPARWGGDEILILLPQAGAEEARAIMTRILDTLRETRIPVPFSTQKELGVTASIGIASYPADGRTAEDLLQRADEALYRVKSRGRNGVATFRDTIAAQPAPAPPPPEQSPAT